MKRRMCPESYNGKAPARDEFAYTTPGPSTPIAGTRGGDGSGLNPRGVEEVVFWCPNGKKRVCMVPLTLGEQTDGPPRRWHWDGNMEAPTITPSIGCDNRCGWHGNVTQGEWVPDTAPGAPREQQ